MNNRTLILTSIYSNLWGTEFGGRPSREYHYKVSLLNILNLSPDKVICYTSQDELPHLEQFFYNEKNISINLLEFKVFDLSTTRYFDKIKSKKDLEFMKSFDRCYEVQYNKLFWCDNLTEIFDYDRIYWFDAGLSHGGLFPEEYSYGEGFDRNFKFNLFNKNFLNYLNEISKNKFIVVGKNNEESFYWSRTLPEQYYNNYSKNIHVVGGFFGGPTDLYRKVSKMFDDLLVNLLISEDDLFVEEQILTTIYYNNPEIFEVLGFDDWYKRENHSDNVKYFYDIFLAGSSNENTPIEPTELSEFSNKVIEIIERYLKEKNLI
jgi:hypothetical protein